MKRTFLVKKDPTIEAQDNWLIMDYRQYAAWRETDEGKNREIVFGKFEACSEDDSIIFMECNEKVSKELKKDCHRKQYIRSRDAETPFQVMSYSTMTFQESEIYGEDVLEDTECNVEESVMQRNRNGEVQHQGTLNKALQRIMRDCNSEVLEKKGVDSDPALLPKFSCHVLRHTFATRMCESGLNVKVVQSVLGHADVTTTLDIYVTVTNDLKKREITAFETYLKTGAKQMANV